MILMNPNETGYRWSLEDFESEREMGKFSNSILWRFKVSGTHIRDVPG